MTAVTRPGHLLSLGEFEQLPEDDSHRYELQEGVLHVTPKAAPPHQLAVARLIVQLDRQIPVEYAVLPDVEVVVGDRWPPTVRVPDVVVADWELMRSGTRAYAKDLLIAVEVISPGSRQVDTLNKRSEYARAGIPFYWIVDLEPVPSLTVLRLEEDVYEPVVEKAERFDTGDPLDISLDSAALLSRKE